MGSGKWGVGSARVAKPVIPAILALLALAAATPAIAQSTASGDSTAFYRALDLEGAGKYREAAVLFRQALKGPSSVSALLGLERAYHELQMTDSLLAPLDTLIRANPKEAVFRSVLLRSLQSLGRRNELA